MTDVVAELAIRNVIAHIANTNDTRRWEGLRPLFADEVTTDYTSLFGGEVQRQQGDELVAGWRRLMSPLDATQHVVGAIEVVLHGGCARAECHGRGYHVRHGVPGGSEWMVAGQWLFELSAAGDTWRVGRMTLRTLY
jgi:hypothetical protein